MFGSVLPFHFFFVFHAKSGTTNNHRNGSGDIYMKALSAVIEKHMFKILILFLNLGN